MMRIQFDAIYLGMLISDQSGFFPGKPAHQPFYLLSFIQGCLSAYQGSVSTQTRKPPLSVRKFRFYQRFRAKLPQNTKIKGQLAVFDGMATFLRTDQR